MKIYLIRHGESVSDVKNRYDGDYDDHLTENGIRDAGNIAKKLAGLGIQAVFSSPKIRALETAEIVKNALDCEMIVKPGLAERDIYGAYPDLGREYPEEEYRRLGELLAVRDAGIETIEIPEHFHDRVRSCFLEIAGERYDAVAIVTHGGPIRCIFREVFGFGEIKKISNGAVIEIGKKNGKFSVLGMNGVVM